MPNQRYKPEQIVGQKAPSLLRAKVRTSMKDWLDESELMNSPPRSEERDWRAVTIVAAARLANRVNAKPASAGTTKHLHN